MNQLSFMNLTLEPIISPINILIISILFFIILTFAIINKSSGIFYRIVTFLIIIFIVSGPSFKIEDRTVEKDIVTIVIDKTESQNITGRIKKIDLLYSQFLKKINNISGLEILEIVVEKDKIIKRFGNYENLISNKIDKEITLRKKLNITNLFEYLNENLNQFSPKKISTIFIFTDGQIHDLKKKINYEKISSPIYFILTGEKKINDKKISIISYPEFGYVNEKVSLKVKTEDFFNSKKKDIKLYIQNGNNPKKTLEIKNNDIKSFDVELSKSGENLIKVFIDTEPNELSKSNNYVLLKINGIRKKLRVLLVSGEPYMGTRVWRNFLKSDPSVDLIHMTVLRTADKNDNTPKQELSLIPFPTRELFEEKLNNFQLVIFDNFKGKNILSPLYYENILSFVKKGGAILEITGPSYNSRDSLFRTAIGAILPGAPTGKVIKSEFKPTLSEIGKIHPITKSLFNNFKNYGSWFEMNKITDIDDRALTLLNGADENPLLTINRINEGRIAQIYSHNLWLWTKSNNNSGGPYNLLIKNLAHWLMKEPTLEENKLYVSLKENNILIKKKFLNVPQEEDLNFSIIEPGGLKINKTLNKNLNNKYEYKFPYKKKGIYIIGDNNVVTSINTDNSKKIEFESLNLTDEIILENPLSIYETKPVWINNEEFPNVKARDELKKNLNNYDDLYILKKNNYIVNGFTTKKIIPHEILIIFLMIFLILAWKKEGK